MLLSTIGLIAYLTGIIAVGTNHRNAAHFRRHMLQSIIGGTLIVIGSVFLVHALFNA